MTEKRKNKSNSKTFKEEAVELISEQSYRAAKAVGVWANQLYRWKP